MHMDVLCSEGYEACGGGTSMLGSFEPGGKCWVTFSTWPKYWLGYRRIPPVEEFIQTKEFRQLLKLCYIVIVYSNEGRFFVVFFLFNVIGICIFEDIPQVIGSWRILGTVDITRDPCTSTIPHDSLPKVQVTRDRLYFHTQESSATVIQSSVHCEHMEKYRLLYSPSVCQRFRTLVRTEFIYMSINSSKNESRKLWELLFRLCLQPASLKPSFSEPLKTIRRCTVACLQSPGVLENQHKELQVLFKDNSLWGTRGP